MGSKGISPKMDESIEETFCRTMNLLANPDFKISDSTYLQILLSKLSKKENGKKLLKLPACTEFVIKALTERDITSDISITVFSLQLLGLLFADEEKFTSPALNNLMVTLTETCALKESSNSSLQLAYVTLFSSLLNHAAGIQWILEKEIWKDVIRIYLEDKSLYTHRESKTFISNLLGALRNDVSKSEAIIRDAFMPLTVKKNVCSSHFPIQDGETKSSEHSPISLTIDLVCSILEATLLNPLPSIFISLSSFDLESFAFHLLDHTNDKIPNHVFITKLGKLICLLQFNSVTNNPKHANFTHFSNKILSLLSALMKKQSISSVLAVALQCHSCLCKIKKDIEVSFEDEQGKKLLLRDQLIYIQITPLLFGNSIINKELNYNFLSHICETTSSNAQQIAIQLKEMIKKSNELIETAYHTLVSILQMKDMLDREPAVVVFRATAFMLWRFARPENTESLFLVTKSSKLLGAILDGLRSLIEVFHLTWRDSLETLCLMSFMIEILQDPNVPSKVVVQAFQLMKRCIEDFIPPNLALLTNSLQNSSLSLLGPLLAKRIHDPNWEVKDSVFEVLECISRISDYKFPVFQEMLLKNNLCLLTVEVGIADSEAYVRASALACLTAMVKVKSLWQEGLSSMEIPPRVIKILKEESEGIVRKEATGLLTELYKKNRLVNTFEDELYQVMFNVATKDLHWEVKTNALYFWRAVIEKNLSDQGMIDGLFPTITFSKVDRKIVTLDQPKIKELVQNVLMELSNLGCLRALLMAVNDYDLNVARNSVLHLTHLKTISLQNGLIHAADYASGGDINSKENVDYVSLLNTILTENEENKSDETTKDITNDGPGLQINPDKFLSFLSEIDLNKVVEQRCLWLEQCGSNDIVSLLDDIIASQGAFEGGPNANVNDMDCY